MKEFFSNPLALENPFGDLELSKVFGRVTFLEFRVGYEVGGFDLSFYTNNLDDLINVKGSPSNFNNVFVKIKFIDIVESKLITSNYHEFMKISISKLDETKCRLVLGSVKPFLEVVFEWQLLVVNAKEVR